MLLGASGAGGSTLLDAPAGQELMATGAVRDVDGKGRHTTSHRELPVLPSGAAVVAPRGCAVLASIEAGDLAQERVDSWRRLQREVAWPARRQDHRLQVEQEKRWKQIHKDQRVRGWRP